MQNLHILASLCSSVAELAELSLFWLQHLKTGFLVEALWLYNYFHAQLNGAWNSILLINVKMPTTVGILTFIGRINTTLWEF